MRQTVGRAQNVDTSHGTSWSSSGAAWNRV